MTGQKADPTRVSGTDQDASPPVDAHDLDMDEAIALARGGQSSTAGERTPRSPRVTAHSGHAEQAHQTHEAQQAHQAPDADHAPHADRPGGSARRAGEPPSDPPPGPRTKQQHDRHSATPWPEARAIAARAARFLPPSAPVSVPLDAALGRVLAAPLTALTDLPSFDSSAMDGWAVAGPGPWDVRGDGIVAGHEEPQQLADGEAVRIATGARVPVDATAVVRSEHGRIDDKGRLYAQREVVPGQDIRPRGQECRTGDQLMPPGTLVTPAVLGLAAAAGYDELSTLRRPRVEVLVLGDELLTEGRPRDGLIRDALGPMLPPWLRALGADVVSTRRLGDDAEALHTAISTSDADLILTTGGTAAGPVDHVHPTLSRLGAELLVNGVKVRPGHPMLLARVKEGRHLVGLPGNPLAAVSGLLTLAEPLLRVLGGHAAPEPYTVPVRDAVHGHPYDTRLVPVVIRDDRAVPLHYHGPAMLRGIAGADGLAVVPPGGAQPGQNLEILDLPWALSGIGVCFT